MSDFNNNIVIKYKPLRNKMCDYYGFEHTDENFILICKNLKRCTSEIKSGNCICGVSIKEHIFFKPKSDSTLKNIKPITIGSKCILTVIKCGLLDPEDMEEFIKVLYKKCVICNKYDIKNKEFTKWKNIVCKGCRRKDNKYYRTCGHKIDYYKPNECLECIEAEEYREYLKQKRKEKQEEEQRQKDAYNAYLLKHNIIFEVPNYDLIVRKNPESVKLWFGQNKGERLDNITNLDYFKWCMKKKLFKNNDKYDNSLIRNYIKKRIHNLL